MMCILLCVLPAKVLLTKGQAKKLLLVEERWACYTSRRYIYYFMKKCLFTRSRSLLWCAGAAGSNLQ